MILLIEILGGGGFGEFWNFIVIFKKIIIIYDRFILFFLISSVNYINYIYYYMKEKEVKNFLKWFFK